MTDRHCLHRNALQRTFNSEGLALFYILFSSSYPFPWWGRRRSQHNTGSRLTRHRNTKGGFSLIIILSMDKFVSWGSHQPFSLNKPIKQKLSMTSQFTKSPVLHSNKVYIFIQAKNKRVHIHWLLSNRTLKCMYLFSLLSKKVEQQHAWW